jgi:hypothetical protein
LPGPFAGPSDVEARKVSDTNYTNFHQLLSLNGVNSCNLCRPSSSFSRFGFSSSDEISGAPRAVGSRRHVYKPRLC